MCFTLHTLIQYAKYVDLLRKAQIQRPGENQKHSLIGICVCEVFSKAAHFRVWKLSLPWHNSLLGCSRVRAEELWRSWRARRLQAGGLYLVPDRHLWRWDWVTCLQAAQWCKCRKRELHLQVDVDVLIMPWSFYCQAGSILVCKQQRHWKAESTGWS